MADNPTRTTAQLRSDIDSGRMRDKVPVADPATVPLGTGEEAAGAPPTPEAVQRDADAQKAAARTVPKDVAPIAADSPRVPHVSWMLITAGVLIVLVTAVLIYFTGPG